MCPFLLESVISPVSTASWSYAENFVTEDDVIVRARGRAAELGCGAIPPGAGSALRLVAAMLQARAVVELGTGAGVSGLFLLGGMPPDAVLTTVDVEVENQRAAREAFTEAGARPNRTRFIPGRALEVLPRLTDGVYDLVFVDVDRTEYLAYLEQALRLLRPGGVLAVEGVLGHDRVADPAQRDTVTASLRELVRTVRDDDRLLPALLPAGDGLLLAAKR